MQFTRIMKDLLTTVTALAKAIRDLPTDVNHKDVKPRAFLVGGCVRDQLLGVEWKDADMEIYGVSQQTLEALLKKMFGDHVNVVGKTFAVYKIAIGDGIDLDVAIPRRESAIGSGHKDFTVIGDPFMKSEDAARRRDFTMNAILLDPLTGDITDPFDGVADLKAKILRAVDADTFIEDPLRIYRALQFAARFDLTIENGTMKLLRDMVERGETAHLSKERVTEEIRKLLLQAPKPSVGFEIAKELGIIARDYPELAVLETTEQEPDWHPEGNVWIHTMMTLDEAATIIRRDHDLTDADRIRVMLGVLCHDLGKPATTLFIEGRMRSREHEAAGVEPTKKLLSTWTFSEEDQTAVAQLVDEHLKPAELVRQLEKGILNNKSLGNALRRLIKRIYPASLASLLAVFEADTTGRGAPRDHFQEHAVRVKETILRVIKEQHVDEASLKPLLKGSDLLELGFAPGPEMGDIIRAVEQARDEGAISTKEEALAYAKKSGESGVRGGE
jgi:tRNA nucleotidyltransferase (CCA-adding enzyme)